MYNTLVRDVLPQTGQDGAVINYILECGQGVDWEHRIECKPEVLATLSTPVDELRGKIIEATVVPHVCSECGKEDINRMVAVEIRLAYE